MTATRSSSWIDNQPVTLEKAVAAAAQRLLHSRQPLFGGISFDVAGARALYPLACTTGAICDPAGGNALFESIRSLQDRGGFTTTLSEIHERADLLLFITPTDGRSAALVSELLDQVGHANLRLRHLPLQGGDVLDSLAVLTQLLARYGNSRASAELRELARELDESSYAVIVYQTSRLHEHGALAIEMLQRAVEYLNTRTRAASIAIGSDAGGYTANQVFTWLSGLPMRTRLTRRGLEHDPIRFRTDRLLADAAVDCLLWASCFDHHPLPEAATGLPTIVLAPAGEPPIGQGVFIHVSTPGIGSDGHRFRTDGSVLLPLQRRSDDGLPGAAAVLQGITAALARSKEEAA